MGSDGRRPQESRRFLQGEIRGIQGFGMQGEGRGHHQSLQRRKGIRSTWPRSTVNSGRSETVSVGLRSRWEKSFTRGINKVRKGREGIEEGKFRIMMFHDKFKKVSRGGPLPPFENQSFAMAHSEYETIQDAKKVAKWLQNLNPHWTIQVWNWANTPVFTFEGAMVK